MSKVFVVTSGIYSDYSISRVFSTEDMAKKWVGNKRDYDETEYYSIEEYELDDFSEAEENVHTGYWVSIGVKGGEIRYSGKTYGNSPPKVRYWGSEAYPGKSLEVTSVTTDKEAAIKSANDIRARLIALNRLKDKFQIFNYETLEEEEI